MKLTILEKTTLTIVAFALICCCICLAGNFGVNVAYADDSNGVEYDRLFCRTMEELNFTQSNITSVNKRVVHDISLNKLGLIYEFTNGSNCGYVIIVNANGSLVVTEASCDAVSPYYNVEENSIYIKELCYWEEKDGIYYALDGSDNRATEVELDELYVNRYSAIGDSLTSGSNTVFYVTKSENESSLAHSIPEYYYETRSNACVPISAANVIAYYDRFYTDLIENYTPGNGLGNFYRYRDHNQTIEALIAELYIDMQTNQTGIGTTIPQFKSGIAQYCTRKGYDVVLTSAMAGNSFDYDEAKQQIDAKKPLILFVSEMEIADIDTGMSQDTYSLLYGTISHSLSVFGYREIEYNMADGSVLQSNFMLVSTGIKRCPKAYLNVNNRLQIDDAYIVSITE